VLKTNGSKIQIAHINSTENTRVMITVAIITTTHHSESNEKALAEFKPTPNIFVFYSWLSYTWTWT